MPSVREIKRRIQSVKNIVQVTRALEAVSASKARRAQQQAERSRYYTQAAWELLVNVSGQPGAKEHPLLTAPSEVKTVDIVLVTSDRGLAGAYNMNIIRAAEEFVRGLGEVEVRWITVGRKGRDYLVRRRANVIAEFSHLPANLGISDITAIGELIVGDFLSNQAQEVFLAYTDFINVLTQRPAVAPLLPLQPLGDMVASSFFKSQPEQTVTNREYIYEPNATAILDTVVPRFTALQVYQAILEANASEHAARMVAMRNASENGDGLAEDLTLEYNKARQTAITAEMLDIVGGVEALKGKSKKSIIEEELSTIKSKAKANGKHDVLTKADKFIDDVGGQLQAEKPSPTADSASKPRGKGKAASSAGDDLQLIEGIGPKVEAALNASGITTFAQVAQSSAEELEHLVKEVHQVRVLKGASATWPKQAQFLVDGDMDGLKKYQDELVGGR
jgi:F-type H+-transporting ATPase subunit gamma